MTPAHQDDASDAVKAFRATNHGEFARHAVGVGFKGEAK